MGDMVDITVGVPRTPHYLNTHLLDNISGAVNDLSGVPKAVAVLGQYPLEAVWPSKRGNDTSYIRWIQYSVNIQSTIR